MPDASLCSHTVVRLLVGTGARTVLLGYDDLVCKRTINSSSACMSSSRAATGALVMQTLLFLNGKARSMWMQHKKPSKLSWTTTYRRAHKKDQAGEATKRKRRNLHSKRPRAIGNLTIEVRCMYNLLRARQCRRFATVLSLKCIGNDGCTSNTRTAPGSNRCHPVLLLRRAPVCVGPWKY